MVIDPRPNGKSGGICENIRHLPSSATDTTFWLRLMSYIWSSPWVQTALFGSRLFAALRRSLLYITGLPSLLSALRLVPPDVNAANFDGTERRKDGRTEEGRRDPLHQHERKARQRMEEKEKGKRVKEIRAKQSSHSSTLRSVCLSFCVSVCLSVCLSGSLSLSFSLSS